MMMMILWLTEAFVVFLIARRDEICPYRCKPPLWPTAAAVAVARELMVMFLMLLYTWDAIHCDARLLLCMLARFPPWSSCMDLLYPSQLDESDPSDTPAF